MSEGRKLTILVDMDDTIEQLLDAWVNYINKKYNLDVKLDDIHEFDLSVAFPTLTIEQIRDVLMEENLWKTVKPMPNAGTVMQMLIDEGHDIYIVTNSYYKTLPMKLDLVLFKYFPFINCRNVIIASKKQMIIGDVLIDDYQNNLIGGNYEKILITAPHNRDFVSDDVIRVDNWMEIYNEIQKIADSDRKICDG